MWHCQSILMQQLNCDKSSLNARFLSSYFPRGLFPSHPSRPPFTPPLSAAEARAFPSFSYEELKRMVFTHAALSEALRLYPSVPADFK